MTTLFNGAKKLCWNIVFKEGKFNVLSPDTNSQFETEDFNEAINWCNDSFVLIPNDLMKLVEDKKEKLCKEHLEEWERYYQGVWNMSGKNMLIRKVYDFTYEYNELRRELELEHDRNDYDYVSDVLKEMVLDHFENHSKR
ncbi:hypothetical protein QTG56_24620 (plasmid) [Rossellomorea sp. AcN35-11]|nr:hypothetical protein [Rossellomorea aquimaris]WJV31820.1 hypothetical protein QTG56_24620 [Rossellomorea sp. AcN35-11]